MFTYFVILANDIKKQLEAAEAFAATIADPARKQQILDAMQRVKEVSPQHIHDKIQ